MRLFNFVEQHHAVGPFSYLLRERACLSVADIPRRRSNEPGHRAGLHILAHVDANEAVRASVYNVRQRLAKLRFADARWARKEHGRSRALLVRHAASSPPYRPADLPHRRVLPHNARVQCIFQRQKPLFFRLTERSYRDSCALGDDVCHILARDQQHPLGAIGLRLTAYQFLKTVPKRRRVLIRPIAHGLLEFLRKAVLFFFQPRIGIPARQPNGGRRLINQINRLVRQKPVGQIPARELDRRGHRLVRDADAVVPLKPRAKAAQDLNRLLFCRLAHEDLPEPPLQRRVLFDVLAVLLERRRADNLHLAAAKGRL